jgi:hypothetical protein
MNRIYKKKKVPISKSYVWTRKDTKRTIGISLLLLIIILIPSFGGFDLGHKNVKAYRGNTEGVILNITDNKTISQGLKGGNIVTVTYSVQYLYRIASKEYIGNNTFFYEGKYIRFHKEIFRGKKLRIGYKLNQPENSVILID